MAPRPHRSPPHVLIAGGGVAALEAILALRALAGSDVRLTLVSPEPTFTYRAAATVDAFEVTSPFAYELRTIADDLDVSYRRGRLEAVAPRQKWVRLAEGAHLDYDALLIAIGARARVGVAGATTFRDQRDVPLFRNVLGEVDRGAARRLAFAVPTGCTWPLPLYELALLTAAHVRERDVECEVTLVSPERRPLAVFGTDAAARVADVLAGRGVRFLGGSAATEVMRDGRLALEFDYPLRTDRVIAAPQLRGRQITGIPSSWWDFIPTDQVGRVQGLDDVYAAGDITVCPIKQGGLATQQADRIAHTIAQTLGFAVKQVRSGSVLRARLVGGADPLFLRAELDAFGQPAMTTLEGSDTAGSAASSKIFGRYLTPYLEQFAPRALVA